MNLEPMGRQDIPENYRGVPLGDVTVLGKLAVVAGQLEWVCQLIAGSLAITYPQKKQFKQMVTEIHNRLDKVGVPECVPVDRDTLARQVHEWADSALTAMEERHPHIHAASYIAGDASNVGVPTRRHLRDGTQMQNYSSRLAADLGTLEALTNQGFKFWPSLLHPDGSAESHNHYINEDGAPIFAFTDVYPKCPETASTWANPRALPPGLAARIEAALDAAENQRPSEEELAAARMDLERERQKPLTN